MRKGWVGVLLETPRSSCGRNSDSENKRTHRECWPPSKKGEQKDVLQRSDSLQGNSPAFISSTKRINKEKQSQALGGAKSKGFSRR